MFTAFRIFDKGAVFQGKLYNAFLPVVRTDNAVGLPIIPLCIQGVEVFKKYLAGQFIAVIRRKKLRPYAVVAGFLGITLPDCNQAGIRIYKQLYIIRIAQQVQGSLVDSDSVLLQIDA